MGKLALAHRSTTRSDVLPPMELLEPLIERTNHHWYWLGEFHDDGLDRGAEFRWGPPDETPGYYAIPRTLWLRENPSFVGKPVRIENTCGLFTCINPAHWKRRMAAEMPEQIVLPEGVDARVVKTHNAFRNKGYVHIMRTDEEQYVCGKRVRNPIGCDRTTPITCRTCIETWVRKKQPYEVP